MHDPELYEEISQDIFARYNKDKDSNELLSIQSFLDSINEEYIKNKKDALSEFRIVKNNVESENLRDYIKDLELAIFGYYDEEPEYEESIAERTKMRRQKKDASDGLKRTFAPPDSGSDDLDESREGGYDKEGYDGAGYDKWGFNKDGFNKDGFNDDGLNKDGFNKDGYDRMEFNKDGFNKDGYDDWGFNKDGFNKDGKKDKKFNKWRYNINGIDSKGLNRDRYNINRYDVSRYDSQGYNINGYIINRYDRNHYNINGYNARGLNRQGNKRKALKKNIPGSGLKILTPQQMFTRLPILLAQIKGGYNSRELKNEIRQLLYSLYRSKKISKTVYKNLIVTI